MKEQFVAYKQALKLKELGFDEKCIKCYFPNPNKKLGEKFDLVNTDIFLPSQVKNIGDLIKDGSFQHTILAPLWQQAFDWFRKEHGYFSSPTEKDDDVTKQYDWVITKNLGGGKTYIHFVGYHDTYEEAQLACLDKLIELLEK